MFQEIKMNHYEKEIEDLKGRFIQKKTKMREKSKTIRREF